MPRRNYRRCKVCNRTPVEAGPISARGKCAECGDILMRGAYAQLRAKRGPIFEKWYHEMHLRFEHSRLSPPE